MKALLLTALVVVLGLVAVACGDDDDNSMSMNMDHGSGMTDGTVPAGTVVVKLSNWAVTPTQSQLKAGKVTFTAVHDMDHMESANEGGATHELLVAAEDSPGSGTFSNFVLKLQDIKPGDSKTGSVTLKPGKYELSCQVGEMVDGKPVGHYAKGMHTIITVS